MSSFVYIPILVPEGQSAKAEELSLDTHVDLIFDWLKKEHKDDDENEDGDGNNGNGRRRRSRSPARHMRFNRNREVGANIEKNYTAMGFIPILSYSTGADRGRMSSFVMTKYSDENSPALYVSTLRRETIPFMLLRIVSFRDESSIFTIQDYLLRNASIENMSVSGGSGGMSVETMSTSCESLVYRFLELNKDTREILKSTRSSWDALTAAGARDGNSQLASLSNLCKDFVTSNLDQIPKKDLNTLFSMKLLNSRHLSREYGFQDSKLAAANVRSVFVACEAAAPASRRFKRVPISKLSLHDLKSAICEHFELASIKALFCVSEGSQLFELDSDQLVEEFITNSKAQLIFDV